MREALSNASPAASSRVAAHGADTARASLHQHQLGVAAGDDEGEVGERRGRQRRRIEVAPRLGVAVEGSPIRTRFVHVRAADAAARRALMQDAVRVQPVGGQMAGQVVHGDERLAGRDREALGGVGADEQRAGEAGTGRDGDRLDIGQRDPRVQQRRLDHGRDVADVLAACDLGEDAAVRGVQHRLAGDDVRPDDAARLDDGGGRLIARRLDAEDQAGSVHVPRHAERDAHWRDLGRSPGTGPAAARSRSTVSSGTRTAPSTLRGRCGPWKSLPPEGTSPKWSASTASQRFTRAV